MALEAKKAAERHPEDDPKRFPRGVAALSRDALTEALLELLFLASLAVASI